MAVYPGTAGNDPLTGTGADDIFLGSAGNDIITGGGGSDFIYYGPSTSLSYPGITGPITVTVGSSAYVGTVVKNGIGGTDTYSGIRGIYGTAGNDTFNGKQTAVSNAPYSIVLIGGAGNDTINGYSNLINQANYSTATTGIVANLQVSRNGNNITGTVADGQGGTDTLNNVLRLTGGGFADQITGSDFRDFFDASLGNDIYNGGADFDTLAYDTPAFTGNTRSVTVVAGNPQSGLFGADTATVTKINVSTAATDSTDTATGIESFWGSDAADSFVGTTAAYAFFTYNFRGGAGNDTINGQGSRFNRVDYGSATSAVSVDLAAGTASDGQGGTDTLINVVRVAGSNFNDTLLGAATDDIFQFGASGQHSVNGGGGENRIEYTGTDNVTIDLAAGTLTKAAGTDTLQNIADAQGGAGNDTVDGNAGDNVLSGGSGNNTIDGMGGVNTVNYRFFSGLPTPTQGATVVLGNGVSNGSATNPWGGTDTLLNIQAAIGSQFADTITAATTGSSVVSGEGGNDTLIDPGGGNALVSYASSLSGVTLNLALGQTTDDGWFGGQDTLVNFHAVLGSLFNDSLTGTNTSDYFDASDGNDTLIGGGGGDSLMGGAGNDRLYANGLGGIDTLDGGTGSNLLDTSQAAGSGTLAVNFTAGTVKKGTATDAMFSNIASVALTGDANVVGFTTSGATATIYAGAGSGVTTNVTGVGGIDYLYASTGNASLQGGTGTEYLIGAGGHDTLRGGTGLNVLIGGAGGLDVLYGNGAAGNYLYGNAAANSTSIMVGSAASGATDFLFAGGGSGTDYLYNGGKTSLLIGAASGGSEYAYGGTGTTLMLAGGAGSTNILIGASGTDYLFGGAGASNIMLEGTGASYFYGSSGTSYVFGGTGTSSVEGGSGQMNLYAGAGNQTFKAGSGRGFLYEAASAQHAGKVDVVQNFQTATSATNGTFIELASSRQAATTFLQSGSDTRVLTSLTGGSTSEIFVANASVATVQSQTLFVL